MQSTANQHTYFSRTLTRGQISLDAIFTIVILIILISGMLVWFAGYKTSQEDIRLRNELRLTATTAASFITATSAMGDANFTAQRTLPKISYGTNEKYPLITFRFDINSIIVSENISGKQLTESQPLSRPDYYLSYSDTNGILVVHHE